VLSGGMTSTDNLDQLAARMAELLAESARLTRQLEQINGEIRDLSQEPANAVSSEARTQKSEEVQSDRSSGAAGLKP
jgi:hypothetical protein